MRNRRYFAAVVAIAAVMAVLAACATPRTVTQTSTGEVVAPAPAGSVRLVVHNNNFADMDVYVVSDGLGTRLGTVTGNSTMQFRLDPSFFPTNELRIVATPIGGNGRASTGQLSVNGGQTINFTIGPVLRQSIVSVQ